MWGWMDLRAALTVQDQPVVPMDPDRLPARWRELLPEWIVDYSNRKAKAMEEAMRRR